MRPLSHDGIDALIKEAVEIPLTLPPQEDKMKSLEPGKGSHPMVLATWP